MKKPIKTKESIEERLKKARVTLENVNKSEKDFFNVSKKNIINYCNETIELCESLLWYMIKEVEEPQKEATDSAEISPEETVPPELGI